MKKIITGILFAALCAVSCTQMQTEQSDAQKMNIKGGVKQLSEFVRNPQSEENVSVPSDTLGEKNERTDYDVIRVYDFDEKGNIQNIRMVSNKNTEAPVLNQKYEYDKDGLLVMVKVYRDSTLAYTQVYKYSMGGRLTSVTSVGAANGKAESSTHLEYDSKGNMVKETTKNGDGENMGFVVYEYDSRGRMTGSENFSPEGKSIGIKSIFSYDDHGNIACEESKDYMLGDSSKEEYAYSDYDENGNWRMMKVSFMGFVVQEVERTYEYFEQTEK